MIWSSYLYTILITDFSPVFFYKNKILSYLAKVLLNLKDNPVRSLSKKGGSELHIRSSTLRQTGWSEARLCLLILVYETSLLYNDAVVEIKGFLRP